VGNTEQKTGSSSQVANTKSRVIEISANTKS
jgi:DNA-binding protein H-NS